MLLYTSRKGVCFQAQFHSTRSEFQQMLASRGQAVGLLAASPLLQAVLSFAQAMGQLRQEGTPAGVLPKPPAQSSVCSEGRPGGCSGLAPGVWINLQGWSLRDLALLPPCPRRRKVLSSPPSPEALLAPGSRNTSRHTGLCRAPHGSAAGPPGSTPQNPQQAAPAPRGGCSGALPERPVAG